MLMNGVNFSMWIGKSVEILPVLVAPAVREEGMRLVLGLQAGDKESGGFWREFFKDLKSRGFLRRQWCWVLWTDWRGWKWSLGRNFRTQRCSAARCTWYATFWPRCRRDSSKKWRMICGRSSMPRLKKRQRSFCTVQGSLGEMKSLRR